jgi:hypothetical protein
MAINCRCEAPCSRNCCICCSASNQFGDGELDMSTTTGNHVPTHAHMSATTNKVATSSSEIDDIFSRKASIPKTAQHSCLNLKEKKRKHKRSQTQLADLKRPAPEIVFDPSLQPSHASTSKTISHDGQFRPVSSKKRKLVATKQDQVKFRDSRGAVSRKCFPFSLSSAVAQTLLRPQNRRRVCNIQRRRARY